jgi:DNA transformation protein
LLIRFLLAKQKNSNVSLNLLWALEGALTGESWQSVAKHHRTTLLLALEDAMQAQRR